MSSMYGAAKGETSASIAFIILWNVEGAFFRPKGIVRYSHFPFGVIKAVLGMDSG